MNTQDLPERLARAAATSAQPRSVVDDVLATLPRGWPPARRGRVGWAIAAAATAAGLAAAAVFVFALVGPSASLTFAEVRAAFEQQRWVHVRYDAGQNREMWTNLRTGERYGVKQGFPFEGEVFYIDEAANVRRWYEKRTGLIEQDTPTIYPPGQGPSRWTPETAWQEVVGPFEQSAATTRPAGTGHSGTARDTLAGRPVVRFDDWGTDNLGQPILYAQLWADPTTHLPVRLRERLQLGEREQWHKEWATGDYDFPANGPAGLAALGVPPGTVIVVRATTAATTVRPILDAINRCHDDFPKHYRAVVAGVREASPEPVEYFDIVWRNGEQVRDNRYLPAFELQSYPRPPLTDTTPAELVRWATHHEPANMSLMADGRPFYGREYSWVSTSVQQAKRPQVHVTRHDSFTLLATGAWPEEIMWPTRRYAPDFALLPADQDAPANCVGLRSGGQGNQRTDYYVDPARDYVCVKQVYWEKRFGAWCRTRELTLSDLHRVAGHVVAGVQHRDDFANPTTGTDEDKSTLRIDVQPVPPAVYPPGTFDPATLTNGADVVGF